MRSQILPILHECIENEFPQVPSMFLPKLTAWFPGLRTNWTGQVKTSLLYKIKVEFWKALPSTIILLNKTYGAFLLKIKIQGWYWQIVSTGGKKKNAGLLAVWENGELDFLAWSLLVEDWFGVEGRDNFDYRGVSWFWVEHLLFLVAKFPLVLWGGLVEFTQGEWWSGDH